MKIGRRTYEIDWGHFVVLTLVAVFVTAYLLDTRSTSLHINNIIFVQPASILALVLYLLVLPQVVRRVWLDTPDGQVVIVDRVTAEPQGESWRDLGRVAALVVAFGVFVFGLERAGFDAMSWLFITVGLYVCGERNRLALLLYPPIAAALMVIGFRALMPYPISTLVL